MPIMPKEHMILTYGNGNSKILERDGVLTDIFQDRVILQLSRICVLEYSRREVPYIMASVKTNLLISFSAPTLEKLSNESREVEVYNNWKQYYKLYESNLYNQILTLSESNIFDERSSFYKYFRIQDAYDSSMAIEQIYKNNYPEANTMELFSAYSSYSDQSPTHIFINN